MALMMQSGTMNIICEVTDGEGSTAKFNAVHMMPGFLPVLMRF